MDSLSDISSVPSTINSYYEKLSWPGLVGMDLWRAKKIIRWTNNYYIVTKLYKRKNPIIVEEEEEEEDLKRVVIYLDKDGYVAKTPFVG